MFKLESKAGPMIAICAVLFSCFLGALFFLSLSEGPTMRQRDAIGSAATAQAIEVTRESAQHAVTKEAADATNKRAELELETTRMATGIKAELTRYVTHAELSPMLTRQAVLNNDLETQFHLANRAALVTPLPSVTPGAWLPWVLLASALGALGIREWGKTQRARETVTVRTPITRNDIEI